MIQKKKLKIINIDSTILLEEPKINPHIIKMKENICRVLKIRVDRLSIKSTTSEGLGFIGRKQGCAVFTICSLE
jgi:2-C-methyl-D-erythritol 2,4-cyclodiphosphate synthase